MANKIIAMNKLRIILRLHTEGKSKLFISKYCGISRNTVKKYIKAFELSELTYEQVFEMSNSHLHTLFQKDEDKPLTGRLEVLQKRFVGMQKSLSKQGVTLYRLWEEYIAEYPEGYKYTQFRIHYRRWKGCTNVSMRIDHKAGDKMEVDYSGKKLNIINKEKGEIQAMEVFVSILGASQLIYVEAAESQSKENFITSVENALQYYGGVPCAIVPDNLKSAVTKSHRYEPKINSSFEDFAEHYNTTILPARVYKLKDKALVEGAVKIVYSSIYAALREREFYNLDQLNRAIQVELELLNNRKFRNRPYSRRESFNELGKQVLKPLPSTRYAVREICWVTIMKNGHFCLRKDNHYYSVPYGYTGKKVKVTYTSKQVEVYYNYRCIANHKRTKSPYNYTTDTEHLASTHKFISQWNPEYFLKWAANISPEIELLIQNILEKKRHPEQAYRSCIGILSLNKKVGRERLGRACSRALSYGLYNYKTVVNILERGLYNLDLEQEEEYELPKHNNISGRKYYN
jgi:transposase